MSLDLIDDESTLVGGNGFVPWSHMTSLGYNALIIGVDCSANTQRNQNVIIKRNYYVFISLFVRKYGTKGETSANF